MDMSGYAAGFNHHFQAIHMLVRGRLEEEAGEVETVEISQADHIGQEEDAKKE